MEGKVFEACAIHYQYVSLATCQGIESIWNLHWSIVGGQGRLP